jgi:hypothetical protein
MMGDWPNKQGGLGEGDVVGLGYLRSTAMRGVEKSETTRGKKGDDDDGITAIFGVRSSEDKQKVKEGRGIIIR